MLLADFHRNWVSDRLSNASAPLFIVIAAQGKSRDMVRSAQALPDRGPQPAADPASHRALMRRRLAGATPAHHAFVASVK